MSDSNQSVAGTFLGEAKLILGYAARVWRLIPRRHKFALGGASLLMVAVSACNTVLPLLLGDLVEKVREAIDWDGLGFFPRAAGTYLLLIAAAYVVRELLQVARRYLVEDTSTRIEKAITTRLVGHLMKLELGTLTQEKIGALQGRISRCAVGFVRFIRLGFLDFFPPLLTGIFALVAALSRQPLLACVMTAVVPWVHAQKVVPRKSLPDRLAKEMSDGELVWA